MDHQLTKKSRNLLGNIFGDIGSRAIGGCGGMTCVPYTSTLVLQLPRMVRTIQLEPQVPPSHTPFVPHSKAHSF